jgi:hypothetical protein
MFNLLYADIHVGRICTHRQDGRRGVIYFPSWQVMTVDKATCLATYLNFKDHGLPPSLYQKLFV